MKIVALTQVFPMCPIDNDCAVAQHREMAGLAGAISDLLHQRTRVGDETVERVIFDTASGHVILAFQSDAARHRGLAAWESRSRRRVPPGLAARHRA
jgi:hypothetical protein